MKSLRRLFPILLALIPGLALAAAAASQRPLTVDSHVDIPNDYMRQPQFDAGADSVLLVNLESMRRGGLDAVFLVIYVDQGPLTPAGFAAGMAQAERKYTAIDSLLQKYPEQVRLAVSPQDIRSHREQGVLSVAIGIENSFSLGHDLANLDAAYQRGARYLGLVHVGNNDLCTSANPDEAQGEPAHNSAEDHGMTEFGRAAVIRANALGMMVDVSHASDTCARDALAVSTAPIIASHSSARAITDHPRNLPDDLIRAIAAKGGVIQAVAYRKFVKDDPARYAAEDRVHEEVAKAVGDAEYDEEKHDYMPEMAEALARLEAEHPLANLDDYLSHIRHLVDVAGIDHVGIASDFDGGGGIAGWMDAGETPNVTAALRAHGFSEDDIAKLWGGNLLRVWQAAIDRAQQISAAAKPDALLAQVNETVEAVIERYDLPGMAVGIIDQGQVVFARGYGETVAGSGQGIDPDSVFKIASNNKAMTVALLGRLVDQGKLQWSDRVITHLPNFRMSDPWVGANIQVRDLLIHNSGLGLGAGDLMLWPEPNDFTRADLLAGLAHLQLESSFRSTYAYDNLLYIVAGELAAAAGGDSYEALLRREVFEPLGLTRCRVGEFRRDEVGNLAQPHRRGAHGNVVFKADDEVIPALASAPAGGVRCSLNDMLTWARNWLDPELTPGWLSATQRRAMASPHMPMSISARARRWENLHFHAYGYGLRLSDPYGQFRFGHTGTLDGMYSAMGLFPDLNRGYVFLINGQGGDARTVLETALTSILTGQASSPDIAGMAEELVQARAASGAQEARDLARNRSLVRAAELNDVLGVYLDPWFGEIRLCPQGRNVQWAAQKSPRMHGLIKRAGQRLLVDWEDPDNAGAEAWIEFSTLDSTGPTMRLRAVDPELDFSFDFHHLSPHRVRACD